MLYSKMATRVTSCMPSECGRRFRCCVEKGHRCRQVRSLHIMRSANIGCFRFGPPCYREAKQFYPHMTAADSLNWDHGARTWPHLNIHRCGFNTSSSLLCFFCECIEYGQREKLDTRLGVSAVRSITEEVGDVLEATGAELESSARQ